VAKVERDAKTLILYRQAEEPHPRKGWPSCRYIFFSNEATDSANFKSEKAFVLSGLNECLCRAAPLIQSGEDRVKAQRSSLASGARSRS
jgi:hypothetical protein